MKRKNIFKILTTSAISACMLCAGLFPIVKAPVNAIRHSSGTSFFTNYQTLTVGTTSPNGALFGTGGMNDTVAGTLYNIAQEALTNAGSGNAATAEDFSTYVKEANNDNSKEGGVLVKLFDTATDANNANVEKFTQQWWQPVYCDGQVLTLYMAEPYRTSQFDSSTPYKGFYGKYSTYTDHESTAYQNLTTDFNAVLGHSGITVPDSALASPSEVDWHKADQPDRNSSINNSLSLDYTDKIWLPSAYEVLFDEEDIYPSWISDSSEPDSVFYKDEDHRSGLWQMNGYDRAFSSSVSDRAWLRSGLNLYDYNAFAVYYNGRNSDYGVSSSRGLRPALHLNLSSLGVEEPTPTAPSASVGFAVGSAGAARVIAPANGGTPAGGTVSFDDFPYQIKFDASQGHTISTITIGGTTIAIAASQGEAGSGTEISNYCTYKAWYDSVKRVVILELTQVTATGSFNIIASTAVEKGLTDYNGSWWLLGYYS